MLLPGRWAGWGPRDPPLSPPKQISTVLHPQQGLAPRPETAWPEGSRCSLGQTVLPAPTLPSSQQLPGLPDPRFLFHKAEEVRIRGATQAERGKGQAGEPARETVPTVTVGSRAALEAKPSLEPRPQEAGKTAAPTRPPPPRSTEGGSPSPAAAPGAHPAGCKVPRWVPSPPHCAPTSPCTLWCPGGRGSGSHGRGAAQYEGSAHQ